MKPTKEQIEQATQLAEKLASENGLQTEGYQEFWYNFSANEWEKGDNHRLYLNLRYGRTYKGSSKWKRGVTYCIDFVEETVSDTSRDYNNASENSKMQNIAKEVASTIFEIES